jgi:diacylglycerol kinase family enzyme
VTPAHQAPAPGGEGVVIAINDAAGSADDAVREEIERALPQARLVPIGEGDDLEGKLREAAREAAWVGVAGGDGSANAAASVALDAGLPLLVVPAGTLNHLAGALGIEEAGDALDAVARGEAALVDVARIAGKPFLNTASLGGYPELVHLRERWQKRIGKWPAGAIALVIVMARAKRIPLVIDGKRHRIWMIFFGNCAYSPTGFVPLSRESLDDGVIDVRVLHADVRWSRWRLMGAALTGRLPRSAAYSEWRAENVEIESPSGGLMLARDGEVFEGPATFSVAKSGEQLRVAAPVQREKD